MDCCVACGSTGTIGARINSAEPLPSSGSQCKKGMNEFFPSLRNIQYVLPVLPGPSFSFGCHASAPDVGHSSGSE